MQVVSEKRVFTDLSWIVKKSKVWENPSTIHIHTLIIKSKIKIYLPILHLDVPTPKNRHKHKSHCIDEILHSMARVEPAVCYKWTGWVWEVEVQDFRRSTK